MGDWAVGLMTGTALDGNVDVGLIRSDGETVLEFGPISLEPYPPQVRPLLLEAVDAAARWGFEGPEPASFAPAEDALTRAQAAAVLNVLDRHGIDRGRIAAIGFHGQTVLHRPATANRRGATRQLGSGALMAQLTGIRTVNDFRSADVAAGGQGAPLAPIYHRALLRRIEAGEDTAMLNLGGVANISWAAADGTLHAFDTGPANAPLDDWIARHTGEAMDRDGRIAAGGRVDEVKLAALLDAPFFSAAYPKSLDRNAFTAQMAEGYGLEDGAALLASFSAGAVARGLALLPARIRRLVVCGGGRKNPYLMRQIAERCGVEAVDADALGLRGDGVEAECFALLALRRRRGLPISFPMTTGVAAPLVGGVVHPAWEEQR